MRVSALGPRFDDQPRPFRLPLSGFRFVHLASASTGFGRSTIPNRPSKPCGA